MTTEIQAPTPRDTPTQVDHQQAGPSPDPLAAASAGPAERGRLRRRLRKLKALRAKQRLELGTLVFDARRRSNGARPEVVDRRAAEAADVDRHVRELQHVVDPHADARELVAGICGSCQACGGLLSTEDRFCPSCGAPTKPGRARPVDPAPAEASVPVASAPPTGPPRAPSVPTPARPLPANAPPTAAPPIPEPPTAESPAAGGSAITTESPAVPAADADEPVPVPPPAAASNADGAPPPPPIADAPLAHVDRSAIPPPPPPPTG